MRAFIAIDLPEELTGKIPDLQKDLGKFAEGSFQKGNFHLTLKFLGEIKEADEAVKALDVLKAMPRFKIQLANLGVFPSEKYIRVVWIGITQGAEELEKMSKSLNDSLGKKEGFVPHLTIARVAKVLDKKGLLEYLKKPIDLGSFEASKVHLYKSELSPKGAVHTKMHSIELA